MDDLVQRVLLQFVKGLSSRRDAERLHASIYRMARNVIVGVRRSAAAGLFLLRALVAIAVVSRHSPPHFVESGAALLLLFGISTPTAAAVVGGFELWLLAMRSGA